MIQMQDVMSKPMPDFREGSIIKGQILEVRPREVLVDVGYKSEGVIPLSEFEDPESLQVGDEVDVLLERLENEEGMVVLSKEKAAYRQNWNKIVTVFQGDGLIKGKVRSVVKGGLMVNIGVEAFLPASQIDVVPPKDLQQFVGNTYDFKIVKLNDERKNVVLSRREVIEQERSEKRQKFLESVNVGDRVWCSQIRVRSGMAARRSSTPPCRTASPPASAPASAPLSRIACTCMCANASRNHGSASSGTAGTRARWSAAPCATHSPAIPA